MTEQDHSGPGGPPIAESEESEDIDFDDDELEELDEDDFEELADDDVVLDEVAAEPPMRVAAPPIKAPPPIPIPKPPAPALGVSAPSAVESVPQRVEPVTTSEVAANLIAAGIDTPTVLDRLVQEAGAGQGAARAATLERQIEQAEDPERIAALSYELGEICLRTLRDENRAVKAYGVALKNDPTLRANLWAIRRVFYRRELWPNLVKLISAEARISESDTERSDLLIEKAHVLEDRLNDEPGARSAYEEALAYSEGNVSALVNLERLARKSEDGETLGRVLGALSEATQTPGLKLEYLLDAAHCLGTLQGNVGEAFDLLDRAAELPGGGGRAGALRYRLALGVGDIEEALRGLEIEIAEHAAAFGPAGIHPSEPRDTSELPSPADAHRLWIAALRREQARLCSQLLDDSERAWDYLQHAQLVTPGHALILSTAADIAERLGKYAELAELFEHYDSKDADPAATLMVSLRRAQALLRAGNADQGRALLDSLSQTVPGFLPVLAIREENAMVSGDWDALADTYARMAEAAQLGTTFGVKVAVESAPEAAAAMFTMAGDLHASPAVQNSLAAVEQYQQALGAVAGYAPAVEALIDLYERLGQYDAVVQMLETYLGASGPEVRTERLRRLARGYQELGQFENLSATMQKLIEAAPEDVSLRFRYEEVLGDLGRYSERAEVLRGAALLFDDSTVRTNVLIEAARVFEHDAGMHDSAADIYRQLVQEEGDTAFASAALASLYRRTLKWGELVKLLLLRADQGLDPDEAVAQLREAATVSWRELGDGVAAIDIYRRIVDERPGDGRALYALAELYEQRVGEDADAADAAGSAESAAQVLEELADLSTDPAQGAAVWLRAGRLWERRGVRDRARDAYSRATSLAPELAHGHLAMLEVADLANANGVAEIYEALAAQSTSLQARGEFLSHAGWVWAVAAEEPGRAADAFARACEASGDESGARMGLALTTARERTGGPEAAEALWQAGKSLASGYASASMFLRAAIGSEVSGDHGIAHQRVALAVDASPDDTGTVMVACEYPPRVDGLDSAARADALSAWANLCAARATLADNPASRHAWELDSADALAAIGKLRAAGDRVSAVLRVRPNNARALRLLIRICTLGGDDLAAARAAFALGESQQNASSRLVAYRIAASGFASTGSHVAETVASYRKIFELEPTAPEFEALLAIYEQEGDVSGQYELMTRRVNRLDAANPRDPAKVPLLVGRAAIRIQFGDAAGAKRDLEGALEIDRLDVAALGHMWKLSSSLGDADATAKMLERYLEVEDEPDKRAEAEVELSTLLADSLEHLDTAIVQLEHVLVQQPDALDVRATLVSYLLRAGEWERAVQELRELAVRRESPAEQAHDELRIAAVLLEKVGDAARGEEALRRARRHDPLNLDAVRRLADLIGQSLGEGARDDIVVQGISDVRDAIASHPERPRLYERLAALFGWLGRKQGRFFALASYAYLRPLSAEQAAFVREYRADTPALPNTFGDPIVTEQWRQYLADSKMYGVASELWTSLAKAVAASGWLGGANASEPQSARSLGGEFSAVVGVMDALGVPDMRCRIVPGQELWARVVSSELDPQSQVFEMSPDVAEAVTPQTRFLLGRSIAMIRDHTGPLVELSDAEVRAWFAAAVRMAGATRLPTNLELTEENLQAEADVVRCQSLIAEHLSEAELSNLAVSVSGLGSLGDPADWRRACLGTANRAGLLIAADLVAVLDVMGASAVGGTERDDAVTTSLLAWAVSEEHFLMRRKLGLNHSVGGAQ